MNLSSTARHLLERRREYVACRAHALQRRPRLLIERHAVAWQAHILFQGVIGRIGHIVESLRNRPVRFDAAASATGPLYALAELLRKFGQALRINRRLPCRCVCRSNRQAKSLRHRPR
jgi:hypothetical protein